MTRRTNSYSFRLQRVQKKAASAKATSAEDSEMAAGRSAIAGVVAAVGAEILTPGHLGIVNQLAVELHVPVVVAYFMIVFTAAHDVDRVTKGRVTKSPPHPRRRSLQGVERPASKGDSIERTTGRACMLIFMFCFMNGVRCADPGLSGEPGIIAQFVALFLPDG